MQPSSVHFYFLSLVLHKSQNLFFHCVFRTRAAARHQRGDLRERGSSITKPFCFLNELPSPSWTDEEIQVLREFCIILSGFFVHKPSCVLTGVACIEHAQINLQGLYLCFYNCTLIEHNSVFINLPVIQICYSC